MALEMWSVQEERMMKRLVLIATAVAVLAGVSCFFWPSKPLYKARALLRIEATTPYVIYRTQEASSSLQQYVATRSFRSLVIGPLVYLPDLEEGETLQEKP